MTRQSAQLAKLQLLQPGELLPCKQYGYRVLVIARAGAATVIAKPRPTKEVRITRRILTSVRYISGYILRPIVGSVEGDESNRLRRGAR
jgi:hypothetical protein